MAYQVQKPVSEQQIAGMFDKIASRYDLMNRLLSLRQDVRWRREMVKHIPFRPEGSMIDVATGTGDVLALAREYHGEYRSFYGTDISSQMLGLAAKKLEDDVQLGRVVLSKESAEELVSFSDSQADVMTISFGLRNVVHKGKALSEFARVLKPDGVLLILEFFAPKTGLLGRLFRFYFHRILPFVGAMFSDKDAYKYLPESVGSFYTRQELRGALYELGLIVEYQRNFLFGGCGLIKARKIAPSDD